MRVQQFLEGQEDFVSRLIMEQAESLVWCIEISALTKSHCKETLNLGLGPCFFEISWSVSSLLPYSKQILEICVQHP